MKPRITAIVHTLNAERHLSLVLEALKGFDEVLVVDNESTDRTPEIARSHGARLLSRPKGPLGCVEEHRQFGIDNATGEWILEVDADEIVPTALRNYLYDHIEAHPEPHGLLMPIRNYFMGRWMRCYYPDYILRFFSREGTRWPARLHSRPEPQGPLLRIDRRRTDLAFIHLANETVEQSITKMNRYTGIETHRRRNRFSPWQMLMAPAFRFFKSYVLKGGWREGWPGFIHAVHDGIYRFYILAKLTEERYNADHQGADSQLVRDTAKALNKK